MPRLNKPMTMLDDHPKPRSSPAPTPPRLNKPLTRLDHHRNDAR